MHSLSTCSMPATVPGPWAGRASLNATVTPRLLPQPVSPLHEAPSSQPRPGLRHQGAPGARTRARAPLFQSPAHVASFPGPPCPGLGSSWDHVTDHGSWTGRVQQCGPWRAGCQLRWQSGATGTQGHLQPSPRGTPGGIRTREVPGSRGWPGQLPGSRRLWAGHRDPPHPRGLGLWTRGGECQGGLDLSPSDGQVHCCLLCPPHARAIMPQTCHPLRAHVELPTPY